jgi:hypothetical protein
MPTDVQFALTQALEKDGGMLEELLTAYHQYWLTYSEAVSVSYAEEVFQRLPLYREAVFGKDPGGSLRVGKVFAELCGRAGANFAAFGTNVFANAYGVAVGVMDSLDIERTD